MTYQEIFDKIKAGLKNITADKFTSEFAFQCNIIGDGEGAFYIANIGGSFSVEPYDYVDHSAIIQADAETFIRLAQGTLGFSEGVAAYQIAVYGDTEVAKQLDAFKAKKAEKKPEAKKEAKAEAAAPAAKAVAETTPAAPVEEKPAVKAEEKPAAKTEAKTAKVAKGSKKKSK